VVEQDASFDLLIPQVDCFPVNHLCQFAATSVRPFWNYCIYKFPNRQTDGRTDGQVEDIKPKPV